MRDCGVIVQTSAEINAERSPSRIASSAHGFHGPQSDPTTSQLTRKDRQSHPAVLERRETERRELEIERRGQFERLAFQPATPLPCVLL